MMDRFKQRSQNYESDLDLQQLVLNSMKNVAFESGFSTSDTILMSSDDLVKSLGLKSKIEVNRYMEPVAYLAKCEQLSYERWMNENKLEWEKFLDSCKNVTSLEVPVSSVSLVNQRTQAMDPVNKKTTTNFPLKESQLKDFLKEFNQNPTTIEPISLQKTSKTLEMSNEENLNKTLLRKGGETNLEISKKSPPTTCK